MSDISCREEFESIIVRYNAGEQLWDGRFSSVFRLKDEAKVLKIFKGSRTRKDVLRERDILRDKGKHPNIVRLLESDLQSSQYGPTYVMVLENCDKGTLNDYIIQRDQQLTDQQIISFAKDIASGLEHLHGSNLYHGNLHPGNILVKTTKHHQDTCVISGFRCSFEGRNATRRRNDDYDSNDMNEDRQEDVFFQCFDVPDETYTQNSDMFALGVIITAMFSRQRKGSTLVAYLNKERFAEVHDGRLTEDVMINHTRNKQTAPLLLKLLQKDPEQRPNARNILRNIESHMYFSNLKKRLGPALVGSVAVAAALLGMLMRRT